MTRYIPRIMQETEHVIEPIRVADRWTIDRLSGDKRLANSTSYHIPRSYITLSTFKFSIMQGSKLLCKVSYRNERFMILHCSESRDGYPTAVILDPTYGNMHIGWSDGKILQHRIVCSYEYTIFEKEIAETVNWRKEGF